VLDQRAILRKQIVQACNAHLSTSLIGLNHIVQYFLSMAPCLLSIGELPKWPILRVR
jgi:hypothetical protein